MDYLTEYDKACLLKIIEEVSKQFPNVPLEQIKRDKEEIQNVCSSLSLARYEKWKKENEHFVWTID